MALRRDNDCPTHLVKLVLFVNLSTLVPVGVMDSGNAEIESCSFVGRVMHFAAPK